MWLDFSVSSPSGDLIEHCLLTDSIETLVKVLNRFIEADYKLVSAYVTDQNTKYYLPVEAFDGKPINDQDTAILQQNHQRLLLNNSSNSDDTL